MRTRPLLLAALLAAGLTAAVAAPAAAMYLIPDLVQIPAERLVANLERELDAAAPGSADRVRLEIALGRLHAAAWARRTELAEIRSPLTVTIGKPEMVSGAASLSNEIRGELAALGGRAGSVYRSLLTSDPRDEADGCDVAKVAARYDYVGDVVLEITLAVDKAKEPTRLPATKVAVVSQSVGEDAVAACLAARVRRPTPTGPASGPRGRRRPRPRPRSADRAPGPGPGRRRDRSPGRRGWTT